jgi:predicted nucleotidyltransferase component of viral defense system
LIDDSEIRRRARDLDLQTSHIERDYVLCHLLVAITSCRPRLVFRGGTALARVYWPDYRLSEDLDFIDEEGSEGVEKDLREAVAQAGESCGRDLVLKPGRFRSGWSRSTVSWPGGTILVDVNLGAEVAMTPEERRLVLPYSDLADSHDAVVSQLSEILGNKWFMLSDRKEPRDLFDLWAALYKFDVPFDAIARGHQARYGYVPVANFIDVAARLKGDWENRLAHQVADLPDFETTRRAVKERLQEWRQTGGLA